MNSVVKFFHEIIHPHCQHCEAEKIRLFEAKNYEMEQSNRCTSCETLQVTNDTLIRENQRLVEALIDKNKNVPEVERTHEELKPLRTTHIPWNVRRQLKEQESRADLKARLDAAKPNTTTLNKDKELAEIERELQDVSIGTEEKAG